MKKLITALFAAMLVVSCMSMAVSAEEFETEFVTSLDGYGTAEDTGAKNTLEIVYDNVDGVTRPVIKWSKGANDKLKDFGTSPNFNISGGNGTYRITVKYKSDDVGEGRIGVRNDGTNSYPSGTTTKNELKASADSYVTYSKDVVMTRTTDEYVRMRFAGGTECYIAEFKLRRVNDDGSLGENLLPEFYSEQIKGTIEGWATTGTAAAELAYDTVNGVKRPVLKLSYTNAQGILQWKFADAFEQGDYQISVTYYSPKNPGSGLVGLRIDSTSTTFPGNTTDKFLVKNTGHETKTKTITSKGATAGQQYLKMMCQYGDTTGELYIADVKVQKVNADGSFGENLITNSDFMVRKLPAAEELEVGGLMFDVVDNFGGSMTSGSGIEVIPPYSEEYSLESSVEVSNNSGEAIMPVLIAAIYNNGALYDVQYASVEIADGSSSDIEVSVSVPNGGDSDNFTAKTFVWKSMDSMVPISGTVGIGSAE